jgi:hypothetical protein
MLKTGCVMAPQLQENRFELKYIIDEHRAHGLRDFIRGFLSPDVFADPNNDFSYSIHSVYLDNPSLSLMNATVDGHKNRFKLRARYYDDNPSHPIFFEIKRRVNDAILKKRAAVRREVARDLIDGAPPRIEHLFNPGKMKDWVALEDFCMLRDEVQAQGRVIVTYKREAWITPDNNSVRLTMDRLICGKRWKGEFSTNAFETGSHPSIGGVVLELKFTMRYPSWMRDAALMFNLQRTSLAKYVRCTGALSPREAALMSELEALVK